MNDRREIKFRMWDDEENIMIDGDSLAFEEYLPIKDLLSRDNIMQFTGMHDKNGKEIYEGDICKVDDGDNIYEVIFYMGGFRLAVLPRKIRVYDIGSGLFKNIEIIGTTYKFMDTAKQDAERNP